MAERSRFTFRCHNCNRQQTREIRSGHYVTCGHCGASNPGPKMIADLEASAIRRQQESDEPVRRRRAAAQTTVTRRPAAAAATRTPAPQARSTTARTSSATRTRTSTSRSSSATSGEEEPPASRQTAGSGIKELLGGILHGA